MPKKYYGKVRNAENVPVLNAIRNDASLEYRRRIPSATSGNIRDVADAIMSFRPTRNEFIESLINRIGLVYAQNNVWFNELAEFKRGMLSTGDTIEEIAVGLVQAHHYSHDREYLERELFGRHEVDTATAFHKINREDYYPVTVDDNTLRRAFLDETGLNDYTQQIINAPTTSDNWDEYLYMTSIFRAFDNRYNFFNVNVPDVGVNSSTEADAKVLLRKIKAMIGNLKFMSPKYNGAKMPASVKPEDLILFTTPEVNAALDVNALAALFNVEYAKVPTRIVEIRQEDIGMPGVQAFLTTKDFLVVADVSLETTTEFNAVSRQTNYFLHHWEVLSASPFTPIVKFSTAADTPASPIKIADTVDIDSLEFVIDGDETDVKNSAKGSGKIVKGGQAQMRAVLKGLGDSTPDLEFTEQWSVEGNKDLGTRIGNDGLLVVSPQETGTSLTVRCKVSWENTATKTLVEKNASFSLTVVADKAGLAG